jgi:hypothetical protein
MDEVEIEYPLALAKILASLSASSPTNSKGKIRFLFISGTASSPNQNASLWFLSQGRKARGLAETKLLDLAKDYKESFSTIIIKCGFVTGKNGTAVERIIGCTGFAIRVEELVSAMGRIAVEGLDDDRGSCTVSNAELRVIGKKVLGEKGGE